MPTNIDLYICGSAAFGFLILLVVKNVAWQLQQRRLRQSWREWKEGQK